MTTTLIRGGCRTGKTMGRARRQPPRIIARLISTDPRVQLHYEICLANGCTPKLAEALAFREGPALRTDAAFMEGHSNGNQFAGQELVGDLYAKKARAAGVPTQGKIYLHGLANFPGDPEAWVGDRHDVERVVQSRGWGASGQVNAKVRQPEKEPNVRVKGGVAKDILDREVAKAILKEPEIAPTPKERTELREKIRKKLKPHWVKD